MTRSAALALNFHFMRASAAADDSSETTITLVREINLLKRMVREESIVVRQV